MNISEGRNLRLVQCTLLLLVKESHLLPHFLTTLARDNSDDYSYQAQTTHKYDKLCSTFITNKQANIKLLIRIRLAPSNPPLDSNGSAVVCLGTTWKYFI